MPKLSVIMANYNGARHIAAAVRAVLGQSFADLELIVSDDASSDDSVAIARAAGGGDGRLVIVEHSARSGSASGPAAARNRALARARGEWVGIVDSDDFIHPQRFERLIAQAEADGAEIAADDLLTFYEDGARAPHALFEGDLALGPAWIDAAHFVDSNVLFARGPSLGYVKPILKRDLGLHYDESLTIAEDYDLLLRLLMEGAQLRLYPELTYFYRKHGGSISHRLRDEHLNAMKAAHVAQAALTIDPVVKAAMKRRESSIEDGLAFSAMAKALKGRDFGGFLKCALRRPGALALGRFAVLDRLAANAGMAEAGEPALVALCSEAALAPGLSEALNSAGARLVKPFLTGRDARTRALALAQGAPRRIAGILCSSEDERALAPYLLAPEAPVLMVSESLPASTERLIPLLGRA